AELPPEGEEESEEELPPEEEESGAELPPEGDEESEEELPPEEEEPDPELPPDGEEEAEEGLPPQGETELPAEEGLPPQGETELPAEEGLPPQGETELPAEEGLPPQGETELPAEEGLPPQSETELPPKGEEGLPPESEDEAEAELPPQGQSKTAPEEAVLVPPPEGEAKAPPEGEPTGASTKEDVKAEGQTPGKGDLSSLEPEQAKGAKEGEGKESPSAADQKLTPEQEQERRQKYKELVAKVTSLEAEDAYHLLSSLKKAANIKDGVPTGNLEQMEKAVNSRLNIQPPEGFVSSVVQQTRDFGAGVVKDAKEIGTAVTETAASGYNAVKDAINDVRKDPSLITQTLSNARDQLTELGQKAAEKTAEAAAQVKDAVTDVVKHPEIITETIKGSAQQVSDAVSGTVKDAVDTVKEVARNPQIIGDTLKDTVNDLQDVNKVIKVLPGGQKLVDATDPNRPAVDRLKDGLMGATELVGTIDTVHGLAGLAQAGKGKVLEIIGTGLGKESAEAAAKTGAGFVDDAAKVSIAKTGGKDALETTITKSGARTAGEVTEASAKAGSGMADDAAKAATPISKADDALAAGSRKTPEPGSKVSPEPGRKVAQEPMVSRPIEPKDPNYEQLNLTKQEMNKAMAGMPEQNIKHAQVVADKYGVKIQVRPTNPEAKALLESGQAVPKPQYVKMKTITPEDIALGAPEGSAGKVGYFKPKEPLGVPKDSPVYKRYEQRLSEYHDQAEHVADLTKGKGHLKPGENQIFVKDGIVHDAKTGKPFTGDHDLFDIKGLHGEELPSAVRDQVYKELNRGPFKAQHPEHMGWDYSKLSKDRPAPVPDPVSGNLVEPQSPFEIAQGIDKKILDSHRPGGKEPLITFTGGEGPSGMPLPSARDRAGASVFTGVDRPVRLSPVEQYQQSALQKMGFKPEQIKDMKPEQIDNLMDSKLSGLRSKYKALP
ncbi:MAG: hypothetical protein K2W95_08275, partial [Candidatus Obscuribacterales bacterium]|nr:hypothetical protein [Candidatus Obscuribacterales bacterium]